MSADLKAASALFFLNLNTDRMAYFYAFCIRWQATRCIDLIRKEGYKRNANYLKVFEWLAHIVLSFLSTSNLQQISLFPDFTLDKLHRIVLDNGELLQWLISSGQRSCLQTIESIEF